MTPENQRIAIAHKCGWNRAHKRIKGYPTWEHADGRRCTLTQLPNYFNDLNAMHEAEKTLTDEQWYEYREHLRTVVLGKIRYVSQWCKTDIHATASQRAEAFLRTIDKWEESK